MKPQPQATKGIQQQQKAKTALAEWQDELINKADATKDRYQTFFNEFLVYIEMTADELLKQRQQDLLSPDRKIQRRIESQLLALTATKKQNGYAIATQHIYFASISSFFKIHYFPLIMRRGDYPKGDSNGVKQAKKLLTRLRSIQRIAALRMVVQEMINTLNQLIEE